MFPQLLNAERERIAELTEINTRLEFEKKGSLAENSNLEEELVHARLKKHGSVLLTLPNSIMTLPGR